MHNSYTQQIILTTVTKVGIMKIIAMIESHTCNCHEYFIKTISKDINMNMREYFKHIRPKREREREYGETVEESG